MAENTPIRQQYLDIKAQYPHAILFFRLGDFYETFDEDARIVSRELDIVLTSRNVAKGDRVPMAGVPFHAAEGYIARLIAQGYKVAVCEQMGNQTVDGLMPRQVIRVVTPGTVTEPTMLADKRNNYLAAVVFGARRAGVAYADISTGEFATTELTGPESRNDAAHELDRLNPAEIIVNDRGEAFNLQGPNAARALTELYPDLNQLETMLTPYEEWHFDLSACQQALYAHFKVSTLEGFGCEDMPAAATAAGVLLQFIREHQQASLAQLVSLHTYSVDTYMNLDTATRKSLELTETMRDGSTQGSLLGVIDETLTAMGGRLLRQWIGQPLLDQAALNTRLTVVDTLYQDTLGRGQIRQLLGGIPDLERLTNRLVQGVLGPRELAAIAEGLERVQSLVVQVHESAQNSEIEGAGEVYPLADDAINPNTAIAQTIRTALVEEPPATLNNGGIFREGYSQELDEIESSVRAAKTWVAELEQTERERTGIKSLKVGYNKVFGYYLEITKANGDLVPEDYIRKQTLVNAERYITPELKEKEALILNAAERTQELESRMYKELLSELAAHAPALLDTARAVAHLDVAAGLAEYAIRDKCCRPELCADSEIEIREGRHPVVEHLLPSDATFVPNDVLLDGEHTIHVITGPNMSGKSTFLRQVALITLLAQIGSFVPASYARIGLVDRIFARVGAQDQIHRGQSTFMVEMVEMANILNHATNRSLLIIDEIGRGTSTYDGLSIAWAVVEYIHNHPDLRCKTLFATHYHELTELENLLPRVANYNVTVVQDGDHPVFTHHISPGGADRSYGIHVAQMAGMPNAVVRRANDILQELESEEQRLPAPTKYKLSEPHQLGLFDKPDPVLEEIKEMDLTNMTPMEALNRLYELQKKID